MGRYAGGDNAANAQRQAVLVAALELFDQGSYEAVTMNEIAERSGLATEAIRRSFETKDELFLCVLEDLLDKCFDRLNVWLDGGDWPCEPATLAEAVASSLSTRPALPRLLAILHTTLERSISPERIATFKHFLLVRAAKTGAEMERRVPSLARGDGVRLLVRLEALIVGLWQLADPAPPVQLLLRQPGMEPFVVNFTAELATAARALVAGSATPM